MTHSKYVQHLKDTQSKLQGVSSRHLFRVLDSLLYRSLKPVVEHSTFIDFFLLHTLTWVESNHKRKISSLSRPRVVTLIYFYLTVPRERKFKILRELKLERSYLIFILDRFFAYTSQHQKLSVRGIRNIQARAKAHELEQSLGTDDRLYCVVRDSRFWFTKFVEFRAAIVERYYRLIVKEAWSQCKHNPNINFEDIVQNLILSTYRALDKFDPSRGALTSYIQEWFRDAKQGQTYKHEHGLAYSIPKQVKVDIGKNVNTDVNNFAHSLDSEQALEVESPSVDQYYEKQSEIDRIRRLCKSVDPYGFARLSLEIAEIFDKETA